MSTDRRSFLSFYQLDSILSPRETCVKSRVYVWGSEVKSKFSETCTPRKNNKQTKQEVFRHQVTKFKGYRCTVLYFSYFLCLPIVFVTLLFQVCMENYEPNWTLSLQLHLSRVLRFWVTVISKIML